MPLGCYFVLIQSNQKSRQKKASTRPAGSYAFSVLRTLQRLNRHSRQLLGPFLSGLHPLLFGRSKGKKIAAPVLQDLQRNGQERKDFYDKSK
jgi:hypothetical protein